MGNLPYTVKAALTDPHTPLWLPDVTDALVAMGQQTLHLQTGITMSHYGTARVLAGDARAPRHVVACLSFGPGADGVASDMLAECLMGDVARRYQEVGLAFYPPDITASAPILNCVQEAIDILTSLPTLHATVAKLVRVCHLIKPEDDYDVSYSDPQVPFSIFVSVPQRRRPHDALRVAESIVHEAMHLQLTLLEQATPLVHPSDAKYFSPWKGAYRSPQGVLHALYVFRVIAQYLERLLELPGWSLSSIDHMRHRRREIA
jgi:HEXXH motif-containing protein